MKRYFEALLGVGLLVIVLALTLNTVLSDRTEATSGDLSGAQASQAVEAGVVETTDQHPANQFSFGNYIDTGTELVEIDTGQTDLDTHARVEAPAPVQFSFGNYIDTGSELVEIETGQTDLDTPARPEAPSPNRFSFGNYIDTGYELTEIETGQ